MNSNAPAQTAQASVKEQPMRRVFIEKVVVNIGVGEAGEKLIKAEKVLQRLTNMKPVRTLSKTVNRDLGIRQGMPIGCKTTLRGDDAIAFLKKAFWVKSNRIAEYSFDKYGNFSFGINDYTDFEGERYNPDIGIFGMDICATLVRPGRRVGLRKRAKGKQPDSHRLTKQEGRDYVARTFNVEIVKEA